MPFKDKEKQRVYQREYQKKLREKKRLEKLEKIKQREEDFEAELFRKEKQFQQQQEKKVYARKQKKGKQVISDVPKPVCKICLQEFDKKDCGCNNIRHPTFCSKKCRRIYRKMHPNQRQEITDLWRQTAYAKYIRGKKEW